MIDTIVITIQQDKFKILDHSRFSPSTKGLFEFPYYELGKRVNFSCYQNPTKKEILENGYSPRLTVTKRIRKGFCITLRIELSLPKFIYSNNFQELGNNDFENIVEQLRNSLLKMSVLVSINDIKNASVSAIHYGKNILLQNHVTCSMVLNELKKVDLSTRIDIGTEKFRNDGYILHYHTNSFELVFYDKIKDLEQSKISEKRAFEKENYVQLNLLDEIKKKKAFEVLRMEIRLGDKRKIKQIFKKLGIETDLSFQSLFNLSIAKKVLWHYWEEIEGNLMPLNLKTEGAFELFENLLANNPKVKPEKIMKVFGYFVLANEKGFRRLRSALNYQGTPEKNRKWYRLKKDMKLNYSQKGVYKAIDSVSTGLEKFERITKSFKMD